MKSQEAQMMDTKYDSNGAAEYLGTTKTHLKFLRDHRLIGFVKIGHRTIVYTKADLDRFLNRNRVNAHKGQQFETVQHAFQPWLYG